MTWPKLLTLTWLSFVSSSAALCQEPDASLLAEIKGIRAIDSHAHPQGVTTNGTTDEFDPPVNVPPLGPPALLRLTNPAWSRTWQLLHGTTSRDSAHILRQRARAKYGAGYPVHVLDILNIETMLANRHSITAGLDKPRFRLVWFVDPLVFPLNNDSLKAINPQVKDAIEGEEAWMRSVLKEQGLEKIPPTLDEYMSRLVVPALEKKKNDGAVAIKLSIAYERTLAIGNPSRADAERIYSEYAGRVKGPALAEYKTLQDFLIRQLINEAGRLGLPVQIHVGAGSGPFFDNQGADPFLLMPMLLDPSLRHATIVLVHGGFPNAAATRVLFAKPNVYVDFSSQAFLSTTRELSETLRKWLEFRPEKVMFGSDAYAVGPSIGWEEVASMASESSRRALAIALTGMIHDGEITRARASEIARMVMRETAISVYRLDH